MLIAPGIGGLPGLLLTAAADRWSRRLIAAGGAAAFAVGLALFAWAPNAPTLVAAAALMGFGSTGMVDGVEVAMVNATTPDRLRVWLARQNVAAVAGDLAGPTVLAALAFAGLGWRVAFAAGAVALGAYAVLLATAPLPPPQDGAAADATDDIGFSAVLRDGRVWVVGVLSLGIVPFDEPFLGFLIAHLGQTRGASTATATVIALVAVCGGLVVHGIAARRPLPLRNRTLFITGALGMAAGSVVVAVAGSLVTVSVAAFVVSGGLNLCWLALQHRSLTLRPGQAGRTKAVVSTIESIGFALPLAIGAVADTATLTLAMATFAVLGAVLFAVAAGTRGALD